MWLPRSNLTSSLVVHNTGGAGNWDGSGFVNSLDPDPQFPEVRTKHPDTLKAKIYLQTNNKEIIFSFFSYFFYIKYIGREN